MLSSTLVTLFSVTGVKYTDSNCSLLPHKKEEIVFSQSTSTYRYDTSNSCHIYACISTQQNYHKHKY